MIAEVLYTYYFIIYKKKQEFFPVMENFLNKNENVTMDVIAKICNTLHCDMNDIVEILPDRKEEK